MKRAMLTVFWLALATMLFAGSYSLDDPRSSAQQGVGKIDAAGQNWLKQDNSFSTSNQSQNLDNVNFSATSEGIYLSLGSGTYNVKLFALTGQLLWSGDLVQGKFFIPARKGIYFLRINGKSFKVVCK
ncbi:MAG TPA: T9SS type A sorting domain-containing protein [Paludibacteraceae bacterium]|jgi:hypothetical protein|nr:T9SS type A sorting domain-containing protein [Paludibacteraceae bacterium]NLJ19767.1 T9SS type A sorting domain-containing protein [Bacteroidales bacterium]HNZ62221.1 T9SS type A sorting domain-containing protein [Paludibacteraceae bacterium]HOH54818.1 T9SS type A sorting domain-containing protein [Paludibacteraceae bacterium]